MSKWINLFLDEKGIDREDIIEVEGPSGANIIPVGCLVDMILQAPKNEQVGIKNMLVKIDFANASVMGYFKHLAQAVAM